MPAWITSLLREEVTVPMPSAASSTITSRPACASRRATASPITPAPMTTQSTLSIRDSESGNSRRRSGDRGALVYYRFVQESVADNPLDCLDMRPEAGSR